MGLVPVLKPAEVCRLLERLGAPSLLRQIGRDIGLTVAEFLQKR